MSFLGFGRRVDPGLDRQRQAVAHVSAEFAALEQQLARLPELKASFASVWEDVPELDEMQTKMSSMRKLISLLQSRAAAARSELSNFDEPITMVAREIGYGQGLLENLAVTLVTKRGLAASRE